MSYVGLDAINSLFLRRDVTSSPQISSAIDLGSPTKRFKEIHATNFVGQFDLSGAANTEQIQDIVGAMFTGNTEQGVDLVYNDATGKIDTNVNDFTITVTGDATGSVNITDLASNTLTLSLVPSVTENIEDTIGAMFSANVETGIVLTYNDPTGKIDASIGNFDITLAGDVTGSATVPSLLNTTIPTTIPPDSITFGQLDATAGNAKGTRFVGQFAPTNDIGVDGDIFYVV